MDINPFKIPEVIRIGNILKVNFTVIPVETLQKGMFVELEHGYADFRTNVTNDDPIKTAKIALAHLVEDHYYYERLQKMEKEGREYWKDREKLDVFLPSIQR